MSLYHKYRPQKFNDLFGQEHVGKTLTNAVIQGKIGHAYLFSGPRGIGKTTVARLLAKAINCDKAVDIKPIETSQPSHEPCNDCTSCREIACDKSLDVIEIDAASNRGIDEIRDLREKIKFAPSRSKYKVFIIDEVHMLTKEAFNALLKTLEEPPKHAVFIMATTELHKIPPTILSRVQSFNFKRASVDNIIGYLEKIVKSERIGIEPDALRLIAVSGDGSYRDATSILDQIVSMGIEKVELSDVQEILGLAEEQVVVEFIKDIFSGNIKKSMLLVDKLYFDGYDLRQFSENIISYLRKILIQKSNPDMISKMELTLEQKNTLCEISSKITIKQIYFLVNLFIRATSEIKGSSLPQLPLEIAIIEAVENIGIVAEEIKNEIADDIQAPEKNKSLSQKVIVRSPAVKKDLINSEDTNREKLSATNEVEKINDNFKPENIESIWPKILQEIAPQNRSLYLILKESAPAKIENDKFVLFVKFDLYMERVKNKKNYELISNTIEKILKKKYALDFVLDKNVKPIEFKPRETESSSDIPSDLEKNTMEIFEL